MHIPVLRVDHVSIAVDAVAPALARFGKILPLRMHVEPRAGYDDQFVWTDFWVGDFKIELIESARPGSFVERFLGRRGEGFHHLSIEVEDGGLAPYIADLEAAGLRIVDRGDYGGGNATAFISPRSTPGILVQFWQVPGFHGERPADRPADAVAERDGIRFRVDHLAIVVRSIDRTLDWFVRSFPTEIRRPAHRGYGAFRLASFWLAGYKMELLEPTDRDGPIGRFLEQRGEGFHHLSIDVDRLDPLVERLTDEGIRVIGYTDLGGGRRTAFVHPRDAHGVLLQLWEEEDFGARRRR